MAPTPDDIARQAAQTIADAVTEAVGDASRRGGAHPQPNTGSQSGELLAVVLARLTTLDNRFVGLEASVGQLQKGQTEVLVKLANGDGRMSLIEQAGAFTSQQVSAIKTSVDSIDTRVANIERGAATDRTDRADRSTRALRPTALGQLKAVAPIILATGSAIAAVIAAMAATLNSAPPPNPQAVQPNTVNAPSKAP